MNKIRLGMVGCGDIAGYTAWFSRLVPQVNLFACCDALPERAQAFARRHQISRVAPDYETMLAIPQIDAVYLAVPHHLHFGMVLAAAQAGKAVLVEKPLTRTLQEGRELVEAVGNAKVGVNYQYRYDSACYALVRAVRSGALGRIASIRINLPWHRTKSYFEGVAWHKTLAQAGGGTLITQGSHLLDVALWALDEPPVSALGCTASPFLDVEVETLAHGIVQTSGGTLINIASSMVAATEQALEIEVYGQKGTVIYTDRPFPTLKTIGVQFPKERPAERGLHALQRSLAGFAKWLLDDKPFLIPAVSTLPVLAAVDGIYRSAQSGKKEPIVI